MQIISDINVILKARMIQGYSTKELPSGKNNLFFWDSQTTQSERLEIHIDEFASFSMFFPTRLQRIKLRLLSHTEAVTTTIIISAWVIHHTARYPSMYILGHRIDYLFTLSAIRCECV